MKKPVMYKIHIHRMGKKINWRGYSVTTPTKLYISEKDYPVFKSYLRTRGIHEGKDFSVIKPKPVSKPKPEPKKAPAPKAKETKVERKPKVATAKKPVVITKAKPETEEKPKTKQEK